MKSCAFTLVILAFAAGGTAGQPVRTATVSEHVGFGCAKRNLDIEWGQCEIPKFVPALMPYIEAFCVKPNDPATINRLALAAALNERLLTPPSFKFRGDIVWLNGTYMIRIDPTVVNDPDAALPWYTYATARVNWRRERKQVESDPRTIEEEIYAVEFMVQAWSKLQADKPNLRNVEMSLLQSLSARKYVSAFVYFERFAPDPAAGFSTWGATHHDLLVQYVKEVLLVEPKTAPDVSAPTALARTPPVATSRVHPSPERVRILKQRNREILSEIAEARRESLQYDSFKSEREAPLHLLAAKNLLELQEIDDAEKHLRVAIDQAADIGTSVLARRLLAGIEAERKEYRAAVDHLETAFALIAIGPQSPALYSAVADELAPLYVQLGRFRDASQLAQRAFEMRRDRGSAEQDAALALLKSVYILTFESISWNLISGHMREGSPDDFVNDLCVGTHSDKYGRRSPEEDEATFATLVVSECLPGETPGACELTRHVRRQMENGNFVPAAKYLSMRFLIGTFPPPMLFSLRGAKVSNEMGMLAALKGFIGRGDLRARKALIQYLVEKGIVLEEEVEAAPTELPTQIEFSEVRAALANATQKGAYIPQRLSEIIEVFADAHEFARRNDLD